MPTGQRICLVSPNHVSRNPRLVKEANALAKAGHDVHVIAGHFFPAMDENDRTILRSAPWKFQLVDLRKSFPALGFKIFRKGLRALGSNVVSRSLTASGIAHHAGVPLLAAAASAHDCDLYIGHCIAGLAAVHLASQRTGTPFSFDAEDYHDAETEFSIEDPVESYVISRIQRDALSKCQHVTAASPLIADAIAERYGIPRPTPILNVFPLSEGPDAQVLRSIGGTRKIYWFSQTIGPDRGLENFLAVLAAMQTPCELHLRGIEAKGFREILYQRAQTFGFKGDIVFLPTAPADQMALLAATCDLGLSLELSVPANRDICLSNKAFTYLLAGIPIAMTATTAQRQLAEQLGPAALLMDLADPTASARMLDEFFDDPDRVDHSRKAAWSLAQLTYNWDFESRKFLSAVELALLPEEQPQRGVPVAEAAEHSDLPAAIGARDARASSNAGISTSAMPGIRVRARAVTKSVLRRTASFGMQSLLFACSRRFDPVEPGRTLVIAPHPDDECLGCGALLARLAHDGSSAVHVIFVTDGSRSHPGHPSVSSADLARNRREEARAAMAVLGVPWSNAHHLNVEDGSLAHLDRSASQTLVDQLSDLVAGLRPTRIILPLHCDGSTEHDSSFEHVARALRRTNGPAQVLEFPVWAAWRPQLLAKPLRTARTVHRFAARPWLRQKEDALRAHCSQMQATAPWQQPVISSEFVSYFLRPYEYYFEFA